MTSTPKAEKENITDRTKRRRVTCLRQTLNISSGTINSEIHTTSRLLKSFEKDKREKILKEAGISHSSIMPETMVAMKADMGIPWEKLKVMSR